MKKFVASVAALFALASVACGSTAETETTDDEVKVEVESTSEAQVACYTAYECTSGGRVYSGSTGYSNCKASCAGSCLRIGRCCGTRCVWN